MTITPTRGASILEAINAKVDAMPDDERKAQFRALQAAAENQRREERRARIAARKAEKNETAEMPQVQESNVAPIWPAAKAVSAIKHAHADGYRPVLCLPASLKEEDKNAGKRPARFGRGAWSGLGNWAVEAESMSLASLTSWYGQTRDIPNLGILTGVKSDGGYLVAVDIDCEAPEVVEGIKALVGGNIAIRMGRPERSGLVALVVDELGDHEKFKGAGGEIQLLRSGKQFVAAGIHPDAGRPYAWQDADELPVDMPALAALPRVGIADLVRVLGVAGFHPSSNSASKPAAGRKAELLQELEESAFDADDFDELFVDEGASFSLAELRESNPAFCVLHKRYEDGVGESESVSHNGNRLATCKDFMRQWPGIFTIAHFAVFCQVWPGAGRYVEKRDGKGTFTDAHIVSVWATAEAEIKRELAGEVKQHASTKLPGTEAFGAVDDDDEFEETEANKVEPKEDDAAKKATEAKAAKKKAAKEELAAQTAKAKQLKEEPWYKSATFIPVDLDINKLPPRPYVYNTYLLRGHVTLLSASGGVGKSAWFLFAAIDMACGVDHLGAGDLKRRRKVLVYNAEDDIDEMYRRAGAYMLDHRFTDEMRRRVRENLTLISGVSGGLKLADSVDGRVVLQTNAIRLLEQLLKEREIEVMGLDPLVALHTVSENLNVEMGEVIVAIKGITRGCNIATLLAHHDKKNIGNQSIDDASQDDARGAGTITTPVRVVLSMKRLSKADIKRLNIPADVAPSLFALTKGAKSNYSARDKSARLYQTVSIFADNGTDEFEADSNVSLRPYKVASVGPRISDDHRDAILAEIGKGTDRSDPQANGPLVDFISEVVGADDADAEWRRHVKSVLAQWLAVGWLAVDKAKLQGHKREVPVFKIGPTTPPPAAFEPVDDDEDDE